MRRDELREWAASTSVSRSAWQVGVMLACHADPAGDCHPSIALLANETHLSPATVRRALDELEAAGTVVVTRRKGGVSVYRWANERAHPDERAHSDNRAQKRPQPRSKTGVTALTQMSARSDEVKRSGTAPRSKGDAAPPKGAASPVFTDERGTFLPGTGYIHTPTTHSEIDVGRKLTPEELAAMRAAAGLPPWVRRFSR